MDEILDFIKNNDTTHFLVWVLLAILIAMVFYVAFIFIFRKSVKRIYPDLYGKITIKIRKPAFALFFTIGALIPFILDTEKEDWKIMLQQLLIMILIFSLAWLLIKLIHVIKLFVMEHYDIGSADNLKARKVYTQYQIMERIGIFVIVFITLGIALWSFDPIKEIGLSLLTSAGVSALIIGLAAQRIIAAFLAGIQLAITQPIRIDDVVIVEGEWGRIEEINLTYVVVRIWDKRRLVLPTTYFIEKPFQNWTMVSADILGTVFIYTDYKFPVEELRKVLEGFLRQSPKWDGEVNVLQVTNVNDRSMELRALMSAANAGDAWDLRVFMREKILGFIQENYPEYLPRTRVEMGKDGLNVEETKKQS